MQKESKTFDKIDAEAERIGVIGSPSETSGVKVDILGHSVDKRLVGALTYFTFQQDTQKHCALGQITEITLRNPWVEDATMRSLIRQKGQVDPITGRQDTHTATMTVGAVFSQKANAFDQSELGTIPPTGTDIKVVGNELLDHLLQSHLDSIYKIGRIYGTTTFFPAWFRHFGAGTGGANEAYHIGIFGKTGSGKSVLARVLMLGYASHPQMSLFVIDPQGEFFKDFSKAGPVRDFVEKKLGKKVLAVNAQQLWLTDSDKGGYPVFFNLLSKTGFLDRLMIFSDDNKQRARDVLGRKVRQVGLGGGKPNPQPWLLHERPYFDRVWNALGDDDALKGIYSGQDYRDRVKSAQSASDPDEMYQLWRRVALLFTKEGRPGAHKLAELVETALKPNEGQFVVVDLSEEGASADVFWNEEVKFLIINKLVEALRERAEQKYRNGERLNALVLLDEAHRFAAKEIPEERQELRQLKAVLVDSVRTTRKYGLGWAFISQTLNSLDRELTMQLRIYLFGYGLAWGTEYRALEELLSGSEALKLYRGFRDPESSLNERQYPFMAVGPLSPLSFSGTPLFFTALKWPTEVLEIFSAKGASKGG